MLKSIFDAVNKTIDKEYCYETYMVLVDKNVSYDNITRKKMVLECINLYKSNPNIINFIFNEKELDYLYSLPDIVSHDCRGKICDYVDFFLYCSDGYFSDYTVTLELKEVLEEAKKIYYSNKEKIENEKKILYISLGIFRTYGALTPNELSYILMKLNINMQNFTEFNYYVKRFVSNDIYNNIRCVWVLKGLFGYSEDLLSSHPKDIRINYSLSQFEDIGINYFDTKSPHYIKALRHKKISDFLDKYGNETYMILAGANLGTSYYIDQYSSLIESLTEDEKADLFTFYSCLPKYILIKNQNNLLSENDANLFYEIMMPFIKFAGDRYKMKFDFHDNQYNASQANEILNRCIKNNFNIVSEYLKKKSLKNEHKSIILNLKKSVKGPFIVLKHLNEGSVFLDMNENLYLVKGIKSSIDKMEGVSKTPALCDTFIFQFKDSIIYSSIIIPYPIEMVGNMKKHYEALYKNKKNMIIKKIN